ncbi:conjugal transfer protein [Streptomyces durhamensis]|uniref:conjugal transfer protein n=1 Tax=Streptomyces durhamensis TaxID=68194 RepID=UPI000D146A91|nr:conjugal transfer protein [Streptomyces durhamensis]
MTDHNGQPGSFGPPQQPQQPQHQAWPAQGGQQAQGQSTTPQPSHPQPQQLPSDAARAQVAAAWVRNSPQAGRAAVPTLPPRETRPQGESKKEKRERERAARKAAYEQKKAAKEQRKKGAPAKPATAQASAAHAPAATAAHVPAAAAVTPSAAPEAAGAFASAPAAKAGAATASRPSRDFDVPRPGGRIPGGGRRTHVALRATLLITTCVFALGSCGVMGLVIGKSSGASTAGLDAADAAKYRLTDFPTQQAATFAEQYALLCMTFSPAKADERRKNLARYASAGVDPDCGWNGQGIQTAVSATWDGTAEQLPEYGANGRYIGVQVRTRDGQLTTLTVPVYVKDLKTGEGMRVAGDVGEMPMPVRADAPDVSKKEEAVDDNLSTQLQQQVLPGYFEAWGKSDSTAMARFTAPDATTFATSGLDGRLSAPKLDTVEALVPKGAQGNGPYTYKAGQTVEVQAVVVWSDGLSRTVRRAYRLTVVNTAQGWFIQDIRGGVLDAQGGRADDEQSDSSDGEQTGNQAGDSPSPSSSPSTTTQSSKDKRPKKS